MIVVRTVDKRKEKTVDKIAFIGSTATARQIMKSAANTLKNVTLKTGRMILLLIFEDAEMEQAFKWSHFGIMSNQGQICIATSRIMVHSSIHSKFVSAFVEHLEKTSILSDPFDEKTYQDEGANLIYGNSPPEQSKGYFITPCVFTDVTPGMSIYREEVFGPVVVITSFENEQEAIDAANDTTYGLGAADIEAGMVWVNSSQDCDPRVPFGGVKQSGIGRELGQAGLEAYSQIKAVHINMGNRL
ncbi:ALDH-like protein [Aureobasidium pullulans EXF-150]|uniref:ALDH-like protein n=1 Tax=Aureobasidium pullulans EXF-150 TaxID=1043002 RepID=A0A074X8R7_AURPU|nr:ALDH-like protein [Aureobasidium pullulans EXF-150]KEQ78457.1 ALDH-like protein [Aureobasidium pullulans EXF-150]